MTAWRGHTPDGMTVEIERDRLERWVVTIASCTRATGPRLAAAITTAGGGVVDSEWIRTIAAQLEAAATEPPQVVRLDAHRESRRAHG